MQHVAITMMDVVAVAVYMVAAAVMEVGGLLPDVPDGVDNAILCRESNAEAFDFQ